LTDKLAVWPCAPVAEPGGRTGAWRTDRPRRQALADTLVTRRAWRPRPDLAAALDASPEAGAFFDSLAQFYCKAYARWIDVTKRRPDRRLVRIAEVIRLLEISKKQTPGT
jgi:Bacteriocin-protection, YdeI or OmpD-Associated